jgi:hypothetical protein
MLKLFQEWGEGSKRWRWWIQVWYIWFSVRICVNATMFPQHNNKKRKHKIWTSVFNTQTICPKMTLFHNHTYPHSISEIAIKFKVICKYHFANCTFYPLIGIDIAIWIIWDDCREIEMNPFFVCLTLQK